MLNYETKNRRKFKRFPIDFEILIHSNYPAVEGPIETSTINDISSGGVSFTSKKPDQYSVGQHVGISIHLPDYDVLNTSLNSSAIVVRISQMKRRDSKNIEACIGLQVDDDLSFEGTSK